jgi:hypothetical protein
MEIHEPRGSRFALALERLQEGFAFTFRSVGFWIAPDGAIEVRAQTSWFLENITEQTALNDLQKAEDLLNLLEAESSEFASLTQGRLRRYVLVDDYGMGGVELCRLVDGLLVWSKGFPKQC